MGDALRHLEAAGALEAMEVDHDDVAQVLQAAMSQHLRTLADQARRFDFFHANVFAFARHHQRAQLQKSELGGLIGTLRQADGELDLHRTAQRVFADAHELVENAGQRKQAVLEDRREAHDARLRGG